MRYTLNQDSITTIAADCLVVPVWKDGETGDAVEALDEASGGMLRQIAGSGDFRWKPGESHLLHEPAGCAAKRILLVGAGDPAEFDATAAAKVLACGVRKLLDGNIRHAHFALEDIEAVFGGGGGWLAARLAREVETAAYRYAATRASTGPEPVLESLSIPPIGDGPAAALARGEAVGRGMNRARELGNLPGNICTPEYLATYATELAREHDSLSVDVLDEAQMRELGMGCLLSVAAGSVEEARLIVLRHQGGGEEKPVVLLGKGITFDTGGISLKPGLAMDEMKFDMCGAASVLGAMAAAAELRLPVNLIGMVAAAENMPGGRATKPGDIVTSMAGKTVEILNTDAEGRLVLCDALTYAERFDPACVIDIATLTGAAVATFGHEANALLGNDQSLMDELLQCGLACLDRAWQLPLWDEYQKQLDSNFADMANIGGKRAGTITAACFLSRYAGAFPWAHLDIAGSAWLADGARKGATGRPVPLLMEFLLARADQS